MAAYFYLYHRLTRGNPLVNPPAGSRTEPESGGPLLPCFSPSKVRRVFVRNEHQRFLDLVLQLAGSSVLRSKADVAVLRRAAWEGASGVS